MNVWVATLGLKPEQKYYPDTEKEDFTEQKKIGLYIESWRPGQPWMPQPICLHFEGRGQKLTYADRIFHNAVGPFISEKAIQNIRPLLERNGYILPLDVQNSDENYYLWWLPCVEGNVDLSRSEKFPNGETIRRYVFNDEKIMGMLAFRPHYLGMYNPHAQGQVFVSEEFKDAWLASGLTGIEFQAM